MNKSMLINFLENVLIDYENDNLMGAKEHARRALDIMITVYGILPCSDEFEQDPENYDQSNDYTPVSQLKWEDE